MMFSVLCLVGLTYDFISFQIFTIAKQKQQGILEKQTRGVFLLIDSESKTIAVSGDHIWHYYPLICIV